MLDPATEREGTAVGATIREGVFSIGRDEGPTPGTYKVRIYASSHLQAPAPRGASEHKPRPMIERIPPRYNTESEVVFDVRAGGANRLGVDVRSDGPSAAVAEPR